MLQKLMARFITSKSSHTHIDTNKAFGKQQTRVNILSINIWPCNFKMLANTEWTKPHTFQWVLHECQ